MASYLKVNPGKKKQENLGFLFKNRADYGSSCHFWRETATTWYQ